MRWVRLSIFALISFLVVAGGAFFKQSIALSLCGILSFNSLTCAATWGDRNRANAASPPSLNEVNQSSKPVSQEHKVADICLFGVCAPVNVPNPVENVIQGELDKAVQQKLRSLLADEIPISGSDHTFYPSVPELPGKAFAPQTLYLTDLSPKTAIPAGDYEIPVHFYCTGVYSFNGRGNRFALAQLKGRMAEALSALYARTSYDSSAPINEIQTLAWAMQSGMAYNELAAPQKALVDKYIPDYRESMQRSFVDRLTGISGDVSRISGGRIPDITQVLNKLGPVGDVTQSLLRAREQMLRTNYSHQPLAQEFSPQKDFFLEGGVEKTPWSRVQDNVYMRSIAPQGALHDGTVQVRILNNGSRAADGSYQVAQAPSLLDTPPALIGIITAKALLTVVTQSVAVSEASYGQAAMATPLTQDVLQIVRQLNGEYAGWRNGLDPCPCDVAKARANPRFRDATEDYNGRYKRDHLPKYHPGASFDFRTRESFVGTYSSPVKAELPPLRPGQQCVYDVKGKLINEGAGAGTPDAYSPEVTIWGKGWLSNNSHTHWDTKPFDATGMTWQEYQKTWVPSKGKDENGKVCLINKVP